MPSRSGFGKLNDDLDVVRLAVKGVHEVFWTLTTRDELGQPMAVGASECFTSLEPVAFVGIDAAHDHLVLQHSVGCDIGSDAVAGGSTGPYTSQTDDSAGAYFVDAVIDERSDAGTFDNHIRIKAQILEAAAVVGGAKFAYQAGLVTGFNAVQNVNV